MPRFTNSPQMNNQQGQGMYKQYKHQPMIIDHNGIKAEIKETGKIILSGPARPVEGSKDEFEYDEIEIPASLVFKLSRYLRDTRSVSFVERTPAKTEEKTGN